MDKSKGTNTNGHKSSRKQSDCEQGNIRDGGRQTSSIRLDKWQNKFINTKGDKILCCGRQVGKSTICSIDAGEYATQHKNEVILIIAPTERQAYALFEKTLNYLLENYKTYIAKGKERPTKTKITLNNKTKIYCLPTGLSGMGIRFLTVHRLYVDEAAQVPDDVWTAVTPMLLTTGGDTIMLSTPFGKQGEFYRCWINEDEVYNSFQRFSVTSEIIMQNRPLTDLWTSRTKERALIKINQAKTRMSRKEYAQEYLGHFIDDLFQLFSDELIKKSCVMKRGIGKRGDFFLGVDIARMGEDESTFEVIKRISQGNLMHIESIITRKTLTTETHDKILHLARIWNFKKIGIDAGSGSLGVGVLDFLIREPEVKRKVIALNNLKRQLDHLGEQRVKLLKEDMYMNLLSLMEKGQIKLLDDDEVIASLKSVQYEYLMVANKPTKIRIFGNYTHVAEGLIRAAWLANQKHLNIFIDYV